jgi:Asp-tRNA(Asn)/Glu-tRNA(Gln) amidotransferase A subunit family amidase
MKQHLLVGGLLLISLCAGALIGAATKDTPFTSAVVSHAEQLIGLVFSSAERDSMLDDLSYNRSSYEKLRGVAIGNSIPPAIQFNPEPVGSSRPAAVVEKRDRWEPRIRRPGNLEECAFFSVRELGDLMRSRQVTSVELTTMYLERLKKFGPKLECVITITEDLALEQARRADTEIAAGRYRGPLHGIPYGAKDLLAVRGYKTTWGAEPYKDQVIDEDATVIEKLEEAGAVLIAKLTLGALAWGDVWYGGKTRNPWNLEQGSSGSSAGSASATAAGLVAFAIGTETWGSIVSPATRCGATGLRPTFGRVSRTGAMALSWTMDKIGPICRTVDDCALVFEAIIGPDGKDQTLVDRPFHYAPTIDFASVKIGYLKERFQEEYPGRAADSTSLDVLRSLGAELIPITLPEYPVDALAFILSAEAAAAFDDLTRSGGDDLMVRQIKNAWPNVFRSARFIPAVEYIQANRIRYLIIQEMEQLEVDLYIAPTFGGDNLLLTNLTGHPCVVLPNGFDEQGSPLSITFTGRLYGEGTLLAAANTYQTATRFHTLHPDWLE